MHYGDRSGQEAQARDAKEQEMEQQSAELKEKMLRKLAKLKALSERAGTPEEAASAAAMMQELLQKYNLELSEVELAAGKLDASEDYVNERGVPLGKQNGTDWRRLLFDAVGRNNFCRVLYHGSSSRQEGPKGILVGRPANIEAAKLMYQWLSEDLSSMAIRAATERSDYWVPAATWKDSFLRGAVSAIDTRLSQQKNKFQLESEQSTALVTRTNLELRNAVAKFYPKTNRGASTDQAGQGSYDAYRQGQTYGNTMKLDRSASGTASGRRALPGA